MGIPFCKKSGIEKIFSSDSTSILFKWTDQMNTRLSRVFSHLQCSNISPKRSIVDR